MRRSSLVLKLISVLVFVSTSCFAQVEVKWFAETSRPTKQSVTVYHGETISLQPTVLSYGSAVTNITGATLYWQTNGMDSAWWSKPASVVDGSAIYAIFAPTNDCGASSYTFFIGAASTGGTSYRSFGTFKMQDSPGFNPATVIEAGYYPTLAEEIQPYVLALIPSYDPLGSAVTVSNALTAAIESAVAPLASALQTNRTEVTWSSQTNYTDALGNQYVIIDKPKATLTCTSATDQEHWVGEVWIDAGFPVYRWSKYALGVNTELYPSITFNGVIYEMQYYEEGLYFADIDGNHNYNNPFDFYEMNYGLQSAKFRYDPPSVTTNLVATSATEDYVDSEIAKIPLPPDNVTSGWLIWDSGSNVYWVVSCSNVSFTISEAL